jgi:hypothetical protein
MVTGNVYEGKLRACVCDQGAVAKYTSQKEGTLYYFNSTNAGCREFGALQELLFW